MIKINQLEKQKEKILLVGNHPYIIQSVLDFDYLSEKEAPSIVAILGNYDGFSKYFWGDREILLPIKKDLDTFEEKEQIRWFLSLSSGRRVLESGRMLADKLPNLKGGAFFAENVPEKHAIELFHLAQEKEFLFVGPASIGLLIPGVLKLGPIGGVTAEQIDSAKIVEKGGVALMAASGGMTNELINVIKQQDLRLSFALSFGGDRFPMLTTKDAVLLAQNDKDTKVILYYGELGGVDEYELIELKEKGELTKPVVIHIGGTVADLFPESPQFGHAKAKASRQDERAEVKRKELKKAGFFVSSKFKEVGNLLKKAHE